MKRRIILEVDDTHYEAAVNAYESGRLDFGSQMGLVLGQARHPGSRARAAENIKAFGVTLISDEQL